MLDNWNIRCNFVAEKQMITIMIEREALKHLRTWRKSENRRPLIMRGARQVGKTTIASEFAKEFDHFLHLNLEQPDDRSLFENDLRLEDKVGLMFARKGIPRHDGSTLLFIDEIQQSPQAVASLRYLYEMMPDQCVIAAGSLLENLVDVKATFPVGRVDYLPVRPCSFTEFLHALNRAPELLAADRPELTVPFHADYMSLFNQYCIVGGLPEVVQHYATHRDLLSIDSICSRLMRAYLDDVEKYCRRSKLAAVVRHIIEYGWSEAGSIIKLGGFAGSAYQAREVREAFHLLQKAMLLELVFPSTSPQLPSIPDLKRMPKLFWFDTGLLNYAAMVRSALIGASDIMDVWRGRIGEHVVAQELLATTTDINRHRAFWTRGRGENGAEVDLTWVIDSKLIPIEVKTGHNAHLKSLHSFMDLSPLDLAVRVWSGPFSVDHLTTSLHKKPFKLINLPFYLVWDIERIVRRELS